MDPDSEGALAAPRDTDDAAPGAGAPWPRVACDKGCAAPRAVAPLARAGEGDGEGASVDKAGRGRATAPNGAFGIRPPLNAASTPPATDPHGSSFPGMLIAASTWRVEPPRLRNALGRSLDLSRSGERSCRRWGASLVCLVAWRAGGSSSVYVDLDAGDRVLLADACLDEGVAARADF